MKDFFCNTGLRFRIKGNTFPKRNIRKQSFFLNQLKTGKYHTYWSDKKGVSRNFFYLQKRKLCSIGLFVKKKVIEGKSGRTSIILKIEKYWILKEKKPVWKWFLREIEKVFYELSEEKNVHTSGTFLRLLLLLLLALEGEKNYDKKGYFT